MRSLYDRCTVGVHSVLVRPLVVKWSIPTRWSFVRLKRSARSAYTRRVQRTLGEFSVHSARSAYTRRVQRTLGAFSVHSASSAYTRRVQRTLGEFSVHSIHSRFMIICDWSFSERRALGIRSASVRCMLGVEAFNVWQARAFWRQSYNFLLLFYALGIRSVSVRRYSVTNLERKGPAADVVITVRQMYQPLFITSMDIVCFVSDQDY
jgi:hypothetical protein